MQPVAGDLARALLVQPSGLHPLCQSLGQPLLEQHPAGKDPLRTICVKSWFPLNCTDKEYVIAQYDGAVAYMGACIGIIVATLVSLGIEEETLVVITCDHGETLHDHDCSYDHHGMYDCTLHIPLAFVYPGKVPEGYYIPDIVQQKDPTPTILDLRGVEAGIPTDGRSLVPLMTGEEREAAPEFHITEATWMRKHGWRTPAWKLIHALEPSDTISLTSQLVPLLGAGHILAVTYW